MTDGMDYELTKNDRKKIKLNLKKANNLVTQKDHKTLDKIPSRTILWFLYKRHKLGIYMTGCMVGWTLAFIGYLV